MMDDDGQDPEGLKAYGEETHGWGGGEENYLGYQGCTSKLPKEHHRDGFIFKKCMEFLNGPLPENQPLFLYLSFIKPMPGLMYLQSMNHSTNWRIYPTWKLPLGRMNQTHMFGLFQK